MRFRVPILGKLADKVRIVPVNPGINDIDVIPVRGGVISEFVEKTINFI